MTVLAGLWNIDHRPGASTECARMLAAQGRFGPDPANVWSGGDVALGRQLMRLLPEDAYDRQPLQAGGGRLVLVADLRLDNRAELTAELRISTSEADRLCDAAILLAAFERWGESSVERLIGDYAFALWDATERRFILARDPLGQRPLHYHRGNGLFAFSSMPKGLHSLASVPRELEEESVAEYLMLMSVTGSRSFFRGIERVMPGHIVTVTPDSLTARRHWQPHPRTVRLQRSEEYHEALLAHLDTAVKCRLRGAKDVGAELSGGLDSSAVTSTAARLLAPSGGKVIAFTAVPRESYEGPKRRNRIINEGAHAAATAALYPNIEHVLVRGGTKSPLDLLDRSFLSVEEPIGGLCNFLWGNEIFEAARKRKLTVLLNGQVGNMGLSYAGLELLPELFRSGRWLHLWRETRALVAQKRLRWPGAALKTLGHWIPTPIWIWIHQAAHKSPVSPDIYSIINPQQITELGLHARAKKRGKDLYYRPWKDGRALRMFALQRTDLGSFNKGVLYASQVDRRDPTSDIRLLEFCLAVPTEEFLRGGVPRALARNALRGRVPSVVLEETRKGYQVADWHESLTADRARIVEEIERLEACPAAVRALDLPRLRRLAEEWPQDGWDREDVILSYRVGLVGAVTAGHFIRRATGANA
jgi:asparagine synthase (glutamine-hydrolysing)